MMQGLRETIRRKEAKVSDLEKEERVVSGALAELGKKVENETFLKERVEEQLDRVKKAKAEAEEK